MTLAFGEQKLGDVLFQRLYQIIIHFLHFVTEQSSIAHTLFQALENIVQIETIAVKRSSISSAMKAKPAYQMVKISIFIHTDQMTR